MKCPGCDVEHRPPTPLNRHCPSCARGVYAGVLTPLAERIEDTMTPKRAYVLLVAVEGEPFMVTNLPPHDAQMLVAGTVIKMNSGAPILGPVPVKDPNAN